MRLKAPKANVYIYMYPSNLKFYGFLAGWSEDLMTGYFLLNEQSVTNNAVYVANQTSIQGVYNIR